MPLTLRLSPSDALVLRRGHPWLFHGPRYPGIRSAQAGDVVECVEEDGTFVARGLADPEPPIGVRVLTRDRRTAIDPPLIARRLAEALALRARFVDIHETTAYRWCNGEGDGLPGLVVDLYGAYAGVQVYTKAWHPFLDAIVAGLQAARPLDGICTRDRVRRAPLPDKGREPDGAALRVLAGTRPPADLVITESGTRFLASLDEGQKTGLYLDQRENRRRVRGWAAGADLLNLFSYTGGFGLHAAIAGAKRTTNIDASKRAQEAAKRNYALNGLDPAGHRFFADDVFDFLARSARRKEAYDIVICDPPSFATSRKGVFSALKSYRKLAAACLAVLRPGGMLVAASCTAQVTADAFGEALRDGAADAGVDLRAIATHGLPPDHPVPLAFPEGRYLKCVFAVRGG